MFDDTPKVRWSNAWWCKYFLGTVLPILLFAVGAHAWITGTSYAIGRMYRRITFVPVYDFQAFLMGCAFASASIAIFAYCFMRYSDRLFQYHEWLLVGSLIITAVSLIWCSSIFVTG